MHKVGGLRVMKIVILVAGLLISVCGDGCDGCGSGVTSGIFCTFLLLSEEKTSTMRNETVEE